MSSKSLLFAAVVLSVGAPAFADSGVEFVNNEIGFQTTHVIPSKTTRAEVIAELHAAQRAGSIPPSFEFAAPERRIASSSTREQVQREAAAKTRAEREAIHRVYGPDHSLES
ncbi:MAG: DUF4148 domain-containing protein [Burkholderiaceae bacterium]|jgi:hypothetical protein|nr:DUF4148 domain-containing protein [Burkholderiaceae bacterium]MCD6672697.1 DUF4148 domain-containing protein [Burkholderiaceae bacterium]